jgi:hypothetical protein
MKPMLIALAGAVLVLAASATQVGAKASLSVDPDPVTLGSTFTVSGCGYPAPTSITFKVVGPGVNYFTAAEPLATDCYESEWTAWWSEPGAYQLTSYYRDSKGALRKATVVKFTVE